MVLYNAMTQTTHSSPDVELQKALSFHWDVIGVLVWLELSLLSL